MKTMGFAFTLLCWLCACQPADDRSLSHQSGLLDGSHRAETNAYLPADLGDYWLFDDPETPDETVTASDGLWRHYSDFGNLGPMWIHAAPDDSRVYTYTPELGVLPLVDLAAEEGTTFSYPDGLLTAIGEARLEFRAQAVETPAGTFDDTIGIRFGHEHLVVLAGGAGVIAARGGCYCGGFNPDPENHPWPNEHCCVSGLLTEARAAGATYPASPVGPDEPQAD